MTKAEARKLIEENKDNTAWYGKNNISIFGNNVSTYDNLYHLFRFRSGFGEAETQCIIASLVLSGAEID